MISLTNRFAQYDLGSLEDHRRKGCTRAKVRPVRLGPCVRAVGAYSLPKRARAILRHGQHRVAGQDVSSVQRRLAVLRGIVSI